MQSMGLVSKNRRNRPLGVFDSGVGGLTVVKEIRKLMPAEDIIYIGDTARCPYGPKPLHKVREYALQISNHLYDKEVKALVVACNTASAAALRDIQGAFPEIPVIGVIEPGARGAVRYSKNKKVGVIGTIGTIQSGSYERAIREISSSIEVYVRATPDFVDFVERGEVAGPRIEALSHRYLDDILSKGIDALILGCTHYPLLIGVLRKVVGSKVRIISSAQETATEVCKLLSLKELTKENGFGKLKLMATDEGHSFLALGRRFLDENIKEVETIQIFEKEKIE